MTTAAQIKKMVRPLLELNSDLALVGRWIYVRPVHHVARAVLIDATSSADHFVPRWAVIHLFEARRVFTLSWGSLLSNPRQGNWWSARNDPNVAEALVEAIEKQALPWLRTISTLDLYLAFMSQNRFRDHLFQWPTARIVMDAACGDLDAARKIGEQNLEEWSIDREEYDEDDRLKFARLRELCALLKSDDRTGVARLLHAWEALTVKNFKIEHIWEPTPFPLELQTAK